ncbi:MAG: hypothetical protein ACMUIS_01575 [bacterium]
MKTKDLLCMAIIFVLTGALLLGVTQVVYAAGTASGTIISNSASIDYSVNTIPQTPITSSAATFVVDNKVDLTVTTDDLSPVSITPGGSGYVLTFLVTNTGNTVQDYHLDANTVDTGGETAFGDETKDAFDMTSVKIRVDVNGNGIYEAGTDNATFIDELAADVNIYVFIVADAPLSATNGQYASYHLTATTHDGGSPGSKGSVTLNTSGDLDDPDVVQVVFADGQGSIDGISPDGQYSSLDDYKCVSSVLTVTKESTVKSDPINGTSNPKRIPGAVVEYLITVSNAAGAATATGITVSDSLNSEITTGTIAFDPNCYGTLPNKGIMVKAPNLYSETETALTNADDTDEADFGVTAANTVTVTGIDLAAGETATVKFRVIVQ